MARSASLFGLLGLIFLAFGFAAGALVGVTDPYVLFNLVMGAALVLAYLAFGLEEFRSLLGQRSTRYSAGAAFYTLLFVAFVIGANYLSWRHHHQWDLTEAGVYTLAPQSKQIVAKLDKDLEMVAFVEGGQDPSLESLLDSYKYVAPERVKTRLVDPDKEPALVDQMKITTLRSVHLQYGPESFVVTNPAEESITNGIIRVTGTKKKVVYFTEGHGEPDIKNEQDPQGYSAVRVSLEQENYEVKPLLLPSIDQIPDDASVVVLAGPERPLTEHEIGALEAYLKRGGTLLALVGPRGGDAKLSEMLGRWGAKLGNDLVIDREVRLFEGPRLGVIPITKTYGEHPITNNFKDYTVYPQTRTIEPAVEGKKGLQATALVKTSASSWAETNIDEVFTKGTASIDDADRKGPLSIAVAVTAKLKEMGTEPAPSPDGKVPDEARLVVFGTAMFANNQQLTQSRLNNDLFLNSVGWLVGQENLVSIRSRSVRASRAELTATQALQVFYLSVLIVPQLLIVFGHRRLVAAEVPVNLRRILVLLVAVAALGTYLFVYELPQAEREAKKEKLLGVEQDAITGIDLTYPEREIELTKSDQGWRLVKPVDALADEATVKTLITTLVGAEVQKTLDQMPSDLGAFGLDKPTVTVRLSVKGGTPPPAVSVGKNTAIGGKTYVRKGDEPKLYLTTTALSFGLNKQAKDLRNKDLLVFQDDDVKQVEIKASDGATVTLVRKDKEAWTVNPGDHPADSTEARSYLSSLRSTRAADFPDDAPTDLKQYGLDAPRLTVAVTTDKDTKTLLLGGETTTGAQGAPQGTTKQIFAKRGDQPTVYAVGDWTFRSLAKSPAQFRDKTVLGFDPAHVKTVALERKDGSGVTLTRGEQGTWQIEGGDVTAAQTEPATRLLEDLRELRGSDIAAEPAKALGAFGLDAPELRITLTDKDGQPIGTLLAAKHDGKYYAMRAGTETVFEARDYMYTRLDKQRADFLAGAKPAAGIPPPIAGTPPGDAGGLGNEPPAGDDAPADDGDGDE